MDEISNMFSGSAVDFIVSTAPLKESGNWWWMWLTGC